MKLITVQTFNNAIDAHLLKTKLENEGIECFLFNEHSVTIQPHHIFGIEGIQLKIQAKDVQKVKDILNEIECKPFIDKNGSIISCDFCGSTKLYRDDKSIDSFKDLINFFTFSIISVFSSKKKILYRCRKCNSKIRSFES